MSENAQAGPASSIQAELSKIRSGHADAILEIEEKPEIGMHWVTVRPRSLVAVLKLLRDDPALDYNYLCDLTCVDRPDQSKRFCLIYNLFSIARNQRIFLRVRVGEADAVPTVSGVYAAANWAEREVYDLFGVLFEGHPDLTRIMLPDDWEGHPLRKDYPTVGKRPVILFNNVKDVF